jgi:hypothetical protein
MEERHVVALERQDVHAAEEPQSRSDSRRKSYMSGMPMPRM